MALLLVESRAKNPVIPLWLFAERKLLSIYASNFMLSVAAQSFVSVISRFEKTVDRKLTRLGGSQLYHM
jgi:PIN domain nuclease of toxin-antitoxin system